MATWEIYIIRHGIAAERGEAYPDDSKRPLIAKGIARLKREAKALDELGIAFDQIITSPLVRAKQTADVFAATMKSKPPVATTDALAPAGTPAAVTQELGRHAKKARIALVGHEPDLGELAAKLLGARGHVEFRKGAVCAIDVDGATPGGPGTLRFLLPPRMLRRLKP